MQGVVEDIKNAGATLVALTPQLPEHSQTMVDRHKLSFDLLSDPGNAYAAALGIRFEVPPNLKPIYQSFNINLDSHNGDDSWTLPVPGRVTADSSGIVRASAMDPDYTKRPEPEAILEDLAKL